MTPISTDDDRLPSRYIAYFDDSGALSLPDPSLAAFLEAHGYFFLVPQSGIQPQFSISHRHRRSSLRILDSWSVPVQNRTLAVLESRVNEPFPFSKSSTKYYGKIFFSSHYHDSQSRYLFGFPWNAPDIDVECSRQSRVAIIQANKFSSIRGECYSLRRHLIRDLLTETIPVDIFGAGWQNSYLRNLLGAGKSDIHRVIQSFNCRAYHRASIERYRYLNTRQFGNVQPVENKFDSLKLYKFALVIENDLEFLSEKIKDALACGCVTFYLGPKVEYLHNLPGLVPLSPDPKEIVTTISTFLKDESNDLPDPSLIRRAALARFPHPSDTTWTDLGRAWLQTYSH